MKAALLFLFVFAFCGALAQTVSIRPNPQIAGLQQDFVEYVRLDTQTQIRGCMVRLNYDPEKVTFVSAEKGGIWTGFSSFWWRCVHETSSRVRIECIIMGAGLSVTGPGDMLEVTFTAIAGDYTSVYLSDLELYDIDGYPIPGSDYLDGDVLIGSSFSYAKVRCWLQGPYSGGAMLTGQNDLLPLASPYGADPITTDSIPSDVVDWVLMELRATPSGAAVLSKSLWLGADGYLRSPGISIVALPETLPGPYHVVLRHRNHLAMMSAAGFGFSTAGTPAELDLTEPANIYGEGGTALIEPGVAALIAGDADANGAVGPSDRNMHWRPQSGSSGYLSADFNLNGEVAPSDLNNCWRLNTGLASQVPPGR